MGWQDTLPDEVRQALQVDPATLGDFSSVIQRMEGLAEISFRRAVEADAISRFGPGEVVEMGDKKDIPNNTQKLLDLPDKEISLRLDVAIRANKELAKVKKERLDAQDKFSDKANDTPKRMAIDIHVRHVHPARKLAALKRLERHDEARRWAAENGLDYGKTYAEEREEAVAE